MRSIILDVETTGLLKPAATPLDKQPQIIELGALYIDDDSSVIRTISQLIDPGMPLPEIITGITGITDEQLKGKPKFAECLPLFIEFFKGADNLIAHNAPFDTGMLHNELRRVPWIHEDESMDNCFPWPKETICTIQEYKAMVGKWPKLTELYQKIIGEPLEQTHRALDDCVALHKILVKDDFFEKIADGGRDECPWCHQDKKLEECTMCTAGVCTQCVYYSPDGKIICPDCNGEGEGEEEDMK